jgi:hypothetical protein
MKNYGYIGTYSYSDKPISAWGYLGYQLLWAIPVIGWLLWLGAALFSKNQNKKNFARSFFCAFVLALIVVVIMVALVFVAQALGIVDINALLNGGQKA